MAAISPDAPGKIADLAKKEELTFPLLADPDGALIEAWGLRNPEIDAKTIPHPTAIVTDAEGVVRYVRIDRNFRERPEPAELLSALEGE